MVEQPSRRSGTAGWRAYSGPSSTEDRAWPERVGCAVWTIMSGVALASVTAGALVVVLLVLVPVEYYRLALTTQRRLLRANGLVRLGRAYRSWWIRIAAACAAWPHLV